MPTVGEFREQLLQNNLSLAALEKAFVMEAIVGELTWSRPDQYVLSVQEFMEYTCANLGVSELEAGEPAVIMRLSRRLLDLDQHVIPWPNGAIATTCAIN